MSEFFPTHLRATAVAFCNDSGRVFLRIFPNAESCLRLVRALAVEMHENWLEATRYLNMDHLKEHKKEALRALAA